VAPFGLEADCAFAATAAATGALLAVAGDLTTGSRGRSRTMLADFGRFGAAVLVLRAFCRIWVFGFAFALTLFGTLRGVDRFATDRAPGRFGVRTRERAVVAERGMRGSVV
jgi:hypothetical protein